MTTVLRIEDFSSKNIPDLASFITAFNTYFDSQDDLVTSPDGTIKQGNLISCQLNKDLQLKLLTGLTVGFYIIVICLAIYYFILSKKLRRGYHRGGYVKGFDGKIL